MNGDIICISETHMENNSENQPNLENYTWYGHCRTFRHVRANRTHGGVGIFVRDSIFECYNVSTLDKSYDGILGLLFKNKTTNYMFSVYSCYLPPENSPHGRDSVNFFSHLLSQIYVNSFVDASFTCGDFNSRLGEHQESIDNVDDIPQRSIIDNTCNKHGEAFNDFLMEAKMVVTNGRVKGSDAYTSVSGRGKAVVDYIAVAHENYNDCISFDVFPITEFIEQNSLEQVVSEHCKVSDHSPLSLKFKTACSLPLERETHITNESADAYICKKYKYNTMSPEFLRSQTWVSILDYLLDKIEKPHSLQGEIDEFYEEMTKEVFREMDTYIDYKVTGKLTRKKFKVHKPYWNDDLTLAWREMATLEKSFRKGVPGTLQSRRLREDFIHKRKLFDKLLRSTERKYNRQQALEIEQINTRNPTEFWKHISSLGPKKKTDIPMKVYTNDDPCNRDITDDRLQVLDQWKKDFHNLYNTPENDLDMFDNNFYENIQQKINDIKNRELFNMSSITESYNQPFTRDEMRKICNDLKTGKSVGPDMLPNEVLKHEGAQKLLLPFINKCFMENVIPSTWRKAIIVPIPKSATKDPYVPLNYRGISLLSCLYKLFTSLINLRLTNYCESNTYLVDEQNGFRATRSCQDHIYILSSIIRNRKSNGLGTYCAFVDFQKAFDWVNRDLLLYKLANEFNIHGRLFNILSTIYSSSNAQIRINGILTESFNVSSGVRQGDSMSPVLFSMFLNDLAVGIKELNCGVDVNGTNISILLYADDIVLISNDEESLQRMLNFANEWCRKWRMSINVDKTQVVHFRKPTKAQTEFVFQFGSSYLKTVKKYKYLGVIFDEFLDFKLNSSTLADAAGRALGAIRFKLKNLKEIGYNLFDTLVNAGVLTIADYSAGIWGDKVFPKTEQVQYKAARYFLGVHRFASISALLGDMGWTSARTRHKLLMFKLWNRFCYMPHHRITRIVFEWDCNFYSNKRGTWSHSMKDLFSEINCDDLFYRVLPCDLDYVKSIITQNDTADWDLKRFSSDKLRYYNLYKLDKSPAEYTSMNISKYQRSLFSQFRAGILPLEIEIGRYKHIPLNERLCRVCNNGAIEDEIHFLCECNTYKEERLILFSKALTGNDGFQEMDMLDKFVYLMANHERAVISFLSKAVQKRRSFLYHCHCAAEV